jgi:hypothetical protein
MVHRIHILYLNGQVHPLTLEWWMEKGLLGGVIREQKAQLSLMVGRMHQEVKFVFKCDPETKVTGVKSLGLC